MIIDLPKYGHISNESAKLMALKKLISYKIDSHGQPWLFYSGGTDGRLVCPISKCIIYL
jgi:hypothetical protein